MKSISSMKEFDDLNEEGEASLRARLEAGHFDGDPNRRLRVVEYLHFVEGIRKKAEGEMQFSSMRSSGRAADAAERAATASEKSAAFTRAAAWASAIAAVASLIAAAWPVISTIWDLPGRPK